LASEKMQAQLIEMKLDMIDRYLNELCKSFGGKPKPPVAEEALRKMHAKKDYLGMISFVQNNLNLNDIKVVPKRVLSGGPEKAVAWVELPPNMPLYGMPDFKGFEVPLRIRDEYINHQPFESVVSTIAHEFCHIVLRSTRNSLDKSEVATDLAAMTLGYHEFFLRGLEKMNARENSLMKMREESVMEYMKRLSELASGIRYDFKTYLTLQEVHYAHTWIKKRLK
jgi:hypothetical protein